MCHCTPEIRTPFCGKYGCQWPKPEGAREKQQEEGWPMLAGPVMQVPPEIAERMEKAQQAYREEKEAERDLILFNDDRAINTLEAKQRTKQLSVLQHGIRQPTPSPVQFRDNGTALVKGILFTPRDAARMLLTLRMGCRPDQVTDDSIDLFLADL